MVEITNITKNFSGERVLKGVSLNIGEGEVFGIIGRSGAGKSTLLRCINGLEKYDSGSIKVKDREVKTLKLQELRKLRKDIGMIFQSFNLLNRKNVFENIALPLRLWGVNEIQIEKRVVELLDLVDLKEKIKSYPKELSGGQKQRVAIARALALEPRILLCDEATSALDPKTTKSILQLLREINEKLNITIIIVTHQMEVIKEICTRAALMEGGEVKANGTVEELFLIPCEALKSLTGEEEIVPKTGVNVKLFFPKEISQKSIITTMARDLDLDFSIVWGKLEKFRDEVFGSLVINIPDEDSEMIFSYLGRKLIKWEVIEID